MIQEPDAQHLIVAQLLLTRQAFKALMVVGVAEALAALARPLVGSPAQHGFQGGGDPANGAAHLQKHHVHGVLQQLAKQGFRFSQPPGIFGVVAHIAPGKTDSFL